MNLPVKYPKMLVKSSYTAVYDMFMRYLKRELDPEYNVLVIPCNDEKHSFQCFVAPAEVSEKFIADMELKISKFIEDEKANN